MRPGRAWPQRRLRYTWGDAVLTLTSVLFTPYAIGKAEQAGSLVPFWVAYAAGLVAAACWLAYDARRPQAVRRCPAAGRTRRRALAVATPGLVIVGLGLVEAFAPVGLQAVVFGATAGFVLSTMLGYGVLVLRQRRGPRP
jgi:hypothetical protein